jgi:hypothetical protein
VNDGFSGLQDIFSLEAQQQATGAGPVVPQEPEWPSDDSEDEDFNPEKDEDSGGEGAAASEQRENHENRTDDGKTRFSRNNFSAQECRLTSNGVKNLIGASGRALDDLVLVCFAEGHLRSSGKKSCREVG